MKRPPIITDHASDKAKERLGWNRHTLERMLPKIYFQGAKNGDTKGRLKNFINDKVERHPDVNKIRIYGENIYFFSGRRLVTLYRLPTDYIKHANKL